MELISNCSNRELILKNQLKFVIIWEFFTMLQNFLFIIMQQVLSTNMHPTEEHANPTSQMTISTSCFQDYCSRLFSLGRERKLLNERTNKKENILIRKGKKVARRVQAKFTTR